MRSTYVHSTAYFAIIEPSENTVWVTGYDASIVWEADNIDLKSRLTLELWQIDNSTGKSTKTKKIQELSSGNVIIEDGQFVMRIAGSLLSQWDWYFIRFKSSAMADKDSPHFRIMQHGFRVVLPTVGTIWKGGDVGTVRWETFDLPIGRTNLQVQLFSDTGTMWNLGEYTLEVNETTVNIPKGLPRGLHYYVRMYATVEHRNFHQSPLFIISDDVECDYDTVAAVFSNAV